MEDYYWLLLLPVAIIVILLYLVSLDYVLLIISLLTPLSVGVSFSEGNLGLSIPVEPLLIGVCIVFILRLLFYTNIDLKLIRHPLSILLIIYMFWMLVTSFFSEIPMVSFKYLISRIWFIVPLYFAGIQIYKQKKNIQLFSVLYVFSLLIVIALTIIRHAQYGFSEETGHWVMSPFYNDHTAYGAILAFFIPVLFGFYRIKTYSGLLRNISLVIGIIFMMALVLSFSRAAWLSLIIALLVGIIIYLRIKFRWLVLVFLLSLSCLFVFQQDIVKLLEKNTNESSENYVEHVKSVYNISSDASNLERINRWQAAIRMFRKHPVFGWGPGTYQFVYAPFQLSHEKTIISTNAGNKGNAHSEYLGPLAEMGLPGLILVMAIFAFSIKTGLKVYKKAASAEIKIISFSAILALVSYFTHGLLNNFLDTDKASVPVWSFMAIIVAMDLFHSKDESEKE